MIASDVTGVTIGGDRTLGEGNLVSGNNAAGIKIWGHDNFVYGNRVGTNAAGTAALANQAAGVQVEIGPNNTIGGAGNLGNLVSGNAEAGIMLSGQGAYAGAVGTVITNNIVGLDATGATPGAERRGASISARARRGSSPTTRSPATPAAAWRSGRARRAPRSRATGSVRTAGWGSTWRRTASSRTTAGRRRHRMGTTGRTTPCSARRRRATSRCRSTARRTRPSR